MNGAFFVRYWRTLFCVSLLSGITSAAELRTRVSFSDSEFLYASQDGYDLISLARPGAHIDGLAGEPVLPVWSAHIQLPEGAVINDIRTVILSESYLAGRFDIMPGQIPVPTGTEDKHSLTRQLPAVYLSGQRYRKHVVEKGGNGKMRGIELVSVAINPLDYIPLTGEVILTSELEIIVDYSIKNTGEKKAYKYYSGSEQFTAILADTLLNEQASEVSSQSDDIASTGEYMSAVKAAVPLYYAAPSDQIEYLVITTAEFVDEFEPLLTWKTQKGVPAAAVLLSDIVANYGTATDTVAEKVKRCIADFATWHGTLWIVIGADHNNIPSPGCYGYVESDPPTTENNIPTELYYSDIDDIEWDDNGDGVYGKTAGDGDTIDMYPDVFVGRISAYPGKPQHVTNAITKIINYEKNPPADDYAEKFLMTGSLLWGNIGDVIDAEAKSELVWKNYIDPYWSGTKYRFYSSNTDFAGGAGYVLDKANLSAQINSGYNFVHMSSHGNTTLWQLESGYLTSSDVFSLMASGGGTERWDAANIVTMACLTNAFDKAESCLSEAFLRVSGGGAVSYIGSTRYGWGWSGTSAAGVSLQYNQTFYKYLFDGNHSKHIGELLAEAKVSKLGSCSNYGSMRWVQFSLSLMGDPEMVLFTADPGMITASHISELQVGNGSFTIDTDRPGADICLSKGQEIYLRGKTNSKGDFTVEVETLTPGELTVTVTARNYQPYQGSISIFAPQIAACENIYAGNLDGQVSLTWLPSDHENIEYYKIYRADSPTGEFTLLGYSDSEFYIDSLGLNSSGYYYVVAVDAYGTESLPSPVCDTSYTLLPIRTTTQTGEYQTMALEAERYDSLVVVDSLQWNIDPSLVNASGDSAMTIVASDGSNEPQARPSLRYRAYFPVPGTYYVWARVISEFTDNSCYVGIDGQCNSQPLTGHTPGQWSWSTVSDAARIEVNSPGVHVIEVWPADNGCSLDKLVLSTDSAIPPTDFGPATVYAGTMDLEADGKIDLRDFAHLARNWLVGYDMAELTRLIGDWGLDANP